VSSCGPCVPVCVVMNDRGVAYADSWAQTTCTKALCSIAAPCGQRWPTTWSERSRSSEKAVRLSGWHSTKCGILMYMPPPLCAHSSILTVARVLQNFGAIVRSAMFFGARGIILRYYSTAQLFIWWFAPGRECAHSPSCPRTTVKGTHVRRAPMCPRCVPTDTCITAIRLS
jgi:hypothetical protein